MRVLAQGWISHLAAFLLWKTRRMDDYSSTLSYIQKAIGESQLMPTRPAIKRLQGFPAALLETEDKSHLLIKTLSNIARLHR